MEEKYRKLTDRVHPSAELKAYTKHQMRKARGVQRTMKWLKPIGAVAAVVLVFGASVNLSPAFAESVQDIPVVGNIARVLTIRSFTQEEEDKTITVDQPMVADDTAFAADVNEEIEKAVNDYLEKANQHIEAYREAFLATGGTLEEFESMDLQVTVNYDILSQTDDHISFVLYAAESETSAYNETIYYNVDLKNGKYLTLADLLGEDWVNIANTDIQNQMAARTDVPYFTSEEGGFETVDEQTSFYINESGNPVVVFPRYTVAAGGYGPQEFEITG